MGVEVEWAESDVELEELLVVEEEYPLRLVETPYVEYSEGVELAEY